MFIFLMYRNSNQGIPLLTHNSYIYYLLLPARQSNNIDPGLTPQCLINIDEGICMQRNL